MEEEIAWRGFLEKIPPATKILTRKVSMGNELFGIPQDDITLYCDTCGGERSFKHHQASAMPIQSSGIIQFILVFTCKNCGIFRKTYALRVTKEAIESDTDKSVIYNTTGLLKIGEYPPFGTPTPARVISLIGPDRDIFLKGRRSENQGLGIAAFAYYRRVVENQKGRLISEIKKVAQKSGAAQEILDLFDRAHHETQFSKAIDFIKTAIPQSLLIEGHNPLLLLHSALSKGLHAGSDEECLELATAIRVVLTDLAERISLALKEEAELKQALSRLLNTK